MILCTEFDDKCPYLVLMYGFTEDFVIESQTKMACFPKQVLAVLLIVKAVCEQSSSYTQGYCDLRQRPAYISSIIGLVLLRTVKDTSPCLQVNDPQTTVKRSLFHVFYLWDFRSKLDRCFSL